MVSTSQKSDLARSLDFGCIVLAFAAASKIATSLSTIGLFKWPPVEQYTLHGWPPDYVILLVASLVLWAVVSGFTGVYRMDRLESSRQAYWRLARALLLWLGATGVAIFFLKLQTVSRQFNLSFFSQAGALILVRAVIVRDLLARRMRSTGRSRRAVIVGPAKEAEWLLRVLSAQREWYGSVAFADLEQVEAVLNGDACEGCDRPLDALAEVFLLPGLADQALLEECAIRLVKQGRIVHVVPALIDAQLFRRNLGDIAGVPAITLETANPDHLETIAKRLMDLAGASVMLVLFSPLMAIIALLVKLSSRGPVIFSQRRLGKHGRTFTIFKFRTMRPDAEELLARNPELYELYRRNNFKLPDGQDYRITPLGKLLRASSLDEMPQLFNVLRGEMSLVGPRPIVPAELEKYGQYAPLLLSLKPGMTGNWQVSGRSRISEYSDRVRLDLEYARDQSAVKDVEILIRTVGAVARMDGAY